MSGSPAGVETLTPETQKEIITYKYPSSDSCPFHFCPICSTYVSIYQLNPVKRSYTIHCSHCNKNIEICDRVL